MNRRATMATEAAPSAPARRKARRGAQRAGRGALMLVALLLGSSGLLRIATGTSHALASAGQAATEAPGTDAPAAESAVCAGEPGASVLLTSLREREARLAAREAEVADRARAIDLAGAEIDRKLADLVAAEEKLAATLTLADDAADADVARLVTVYENMKPKDAAPLFAEMDPDFAAGFLARMRPETAAAVLAGLDPKTGYTISALLAGRNANAPKE